MSTTVYQTSHDLLCQLLRKVLVDGVQAGRGAAGGIGSIQFRTSATLYALLMAHPLDQEGCCRSCRRPSAVYGRRRRCWVHIEASYWLRQPEEFLHSRVAHEWGLADQPRPGAGAAPDRDSATRPADLDDTDVLPLIAADPSTQPLQTPAIPPPTAPAGWPDPDHGEGGVRPERLRPRRGPSEDPSSGLGRSLLIMGGVTWQS